MGNIFSMKLHGPSPCRPLFHNSARRGSRYHRRQRKGRDSSVSSRSSVNQAYNNNNNNSVKNNAKRVNSELIKNDDLTPKTSVSKSLQRMASNDSGSSAEPGNQAINAAPPGAAAAVKSRRTSIKMTLKKAYTSASTSSNVLTDERRQLIQVTWKQITEDTGKLHASVRIFEIIFEACPELRHAFNVADVQPGRLDTCEMFVRHARVFGNVMDLAVRNVFDLETEVGPILVMFGRRHFYKHQLGFRNEYLTLFARSVSEFVHTHLSESFVTNTEVSNAWRLFISYIIHKVKEGYDVECIQSRKHPSI